MVWRKLYSVNFMKQHPLLLIHQVELISKENGEIRRFIDLLILKCLFLINYKYYLKLQNPVQRRCELIFIQLDIFQISPTSRTVSSGHIGEGILEVQTSRDSQISENCCKTAENCQKGGKNDAILQDSIFQLPFYLLGPHCPHCDIFLCRFLQFQG